EHEVEDRALLLQPLTQTLAALAGRPGAEEPLEGEAGVRLGRHRQGRGRPGEGELVGTRVARGAITRLAGGVAGQLQRGEAGHMTDLPGGDLIDRDARLDVGPGGLLGPDPRQEGRAGAGVVARPVLAAEGVLLIEAGDDLDLSLEPLERLHGA